MSRQWYDPQLTQIMDTQSAYAKVGSPGGIVDYLVQKATNPEPLPFRITTEFKNIRTTGFLDTAAGLAQFGDRRYLEPWMVREESGLGKYNDEMATVEAA